MSDYLKNIVTTIAGDIKALWAKLNGLTKSDVGLSNVDNTADSNKSVASAGKLTTARTISLKGGVTGSASFDGSANVSMTTGLDKFAVREAFGGYDAVKSTSADTLVQNFAVGSKMITSNQSDAPFGRELAVVETFYGTDITERLQIVYPHNNGTTIVNPDRYYGQRLGFLYRRFPVYNPTAEQLRWIPLNSSTLTYRNTTNLPSNVYIDKDGVLKRSTYTGSAPVTISATLGDPTNGLAKSVAHGLDVSKISKVYARCNIDTNGGYQWIPDGFVSAYTGTAYSYLYTIKAMNGFLHIEVRPEAYSMHGKTIDIFIETTI